MSDIKIKNPVLKCNGCGHDTHELAEKSVPLIRYDDANNTNKTLAFCADCLKTLSLKIGTNEKTKRVTKSEKKIAIEEKTVMVQSDKKITPSIVNKILDDHIMGQDKAKKAISSAIATHLRRLENPKIEKSNILLLGPTGTGKTELARTISKMLNLPLVIGDATTFTAHGFVGEDVESLLQALLCNADYDLQLAERGIIFLDEIDKIASAEKGQIEIHARKIQASLLKMMEGGSVKLSKTKINGLNETVYINTDKILFICSGAFEGLAEIINNDPKIKKNKFNHIIETNDDVTHIDYNLYEHLNESHLKSYGFTSEFLGRLPVVTSTDLLSVDVLIQILKEPKNSITRQYQELMSSYGKTLEFTDDFFHSVACEAYKSGLGARSLRKVLESRLSDVLFYGPDKDTNRIIVRANDIIYDDLTDEEELDSVFSLQK